MQHIAGNFSEKNRHLPFRLLKQKTAKNYYYMWLKITVSFSHHWIINLPVSNSCVLSESWYIQMPWGSHGNLTVSCEEISRSNAHMPDTSNILRFNRSWFPVSVNVCYAKWGNKFLSFYWMINRFVFTSLFFSNAMI